jgi:hypothetical protein
MEVEVQRREAAEKIHQALGVSLFKPPPEAFDPLGAHERELLVHGYPPRPDEETQPELHERWVELVSRRWTFIEPNFTIRPDLEHDLGHDLVPQASGVTSHKWSGTAVFPPSGDSIRWVIGQWTVPDIVRPGGGVYNCATWIGLDGYDVSKSNDVVQIGVVQGIFFWPSIAAVWEWFPDPWVEISNFPVSPGDVVFSMVCMVSPTEASFHLFNRTNNARTSFRKTAPHGVSFHGDSAEWILEAPTINGSLSALAQYGDVYFDSCLAQTANNHSILDGGDGVLITMVDGNNSHISTPTPETDQLFKLTYRE